VNVSENTVLQFTGNLASSAVTTMGIAVLGEDLNETVQFHSLIFQTIPTLFIERAGEAVVLSWLTGFTDYALQSTTDLTNANGWTPVAEPVLTLNGYSQVTIPAAAASASSKQPPFSCMILFSLRMF